MAFVIFLLLLFAWHNRFIQDDAFISFRYAANLANGLGLVWNPGEAVEGYTNFLWTILISGGMFVGFDPILFSYALGLFFFILTLLFTYLIARLVLVEMVQALLVIILLGTNYTFSSFATGGLETQMQTSLLIMATYLVLRSGQANRWRPGTLFLLGLLFSAALLTRLDSALILAPLAVVVLYEIMMLSEPPGRKIALLATWLLPALIITGTWFLWKYATYGRLVPNTFYAKVASNTSFLRGGYYLYVFLSSYWLLPFLLLALVCSKRLIAQLTAVTLLLSSIVLIWCLYILRIGGDFMEFRFLLPILPYAIILLVQLIFTCLARPIFRAAAIALILAGSLFHMLTFSAVPGIGSIVGLKGYMDDPANNWDGIGRALGDLFAGCADPPSIAVRPSGAVPYYSGLPAIDMLGLNDPWIARNGLILGTLPGHQRIAPFSYLRERGTNLIIGHPVLEGDNPNWDGPSPEALARFMDFLADTQPDIIPGHAQILAIPIENNYNLIALYLEPNQCVDDLLRQKMITAVPVQN